MFAVPEGRTFTSNDIAELADHMAASGHAPRRAALCALVRLADKALADPTRHVNPTEVAHIRALALDLLHRDEQ